MLSSPLARAQQLLAQRLVDLEPLLGAGGVDNINAAWSAYAEAAAALAVVAQAAPGAPEKLLTTKELSERIGLSTRTIRRRVKRGELTAVNLGRGVLRWAAK